MVPGYEASIRERAKCRAKPIAIGDRWPIPLIALQCLDLISDKCLNNTFDV